MKISLLIRIAVFAVTFGLFQSGIAQDMIVTPMATVSGTVEVGKSLGLTIYIENNTTSPMTMDYLLIADDLPGTWWQQFCDLGNCFTSMRSGTTSMVAPGAKALWKVTVSPDAPSTGTKTVKWTVTDSANSANSVDITFLIDAVVAVDEQDLSDEMKIFPNPARDFFVLESAAGGVEDGNLEIFNMTGSRVINKNTNYSDRVSVDISKLDAGVYVVRFNSERGRMVKQLIIAE